MDNMHLNTLIIDATFGYAVDTTFADAGRAICVDGPAGVAT